MVKRVLLVRKGESEITAWQHLGFKFLGKLFSILFLFYFSAVFIKCLVHVKIFRNPKDKYTQLLTADFQSGRVDKCPRTGMK